MKKKDYPFLKHGLRTVSAAIIFSVLGPLASAAATEKIIILNEGMWQADNGRMTYFEDNHVVSNQWFREINGIKLGDTPNDIIRVNNDLLAIAINWSNIIQFMRPDGTAVAATENVPNNRKLATDGQYVYVSSYGHECETIHGMDYFIKGYVAKIEIENFKVVETCEVGFEPEGIALYDGYIFVANTGGYAFQEDHEYETTVDIIDSRTMKKVKTVDTGVINLYGKMSQCGRYLCINSPGDYYDVPANGIIFDCQRALDDDDDPFYVIPYATTYNCATVEDKFLAIGSRYSYYTGEYTFNYCTIDPALVMESDGSEGIEEVLPGEMLNDIMKMTSPYGIYQNPYTGMFYGTDAGSFAGAGLLYQWDKEGKLLGKHTIYINPGHFLALPPDDFDSVTTAVGGKEPNGVNETFYDILGRKIIKPEKGNVYIRNGKKFIYR